MISIKCCKGLPVEYESFLVKKYQSFMTTCRYIEIYYPTYDINYMLVYNDNNLIELLIFGISGDASTCFNSLVHIDKSIVKELATNTFEEYANIKKIIIDASFEEYALKKSILTSKFNDYIINLPPTMEDYYNELGRSTRQHAKNRKSRLLRDYPDVKFITKLGTEIEAEIVEKIIQLNIDRMKHKGKIPGRDNTDMINNFKYSQYYGSVTYIEINGVIVAGCISTVLNKSIYSHIIAHDDNFSKYSIGEVCALHLIQTSIEKGLFTLHSLWGESDLKKRLLAKPHPLFSYLIYRNYTHKYVIDKGKALVSMTSSNIRRSKYSKPFRDAIKNYRKKKMNKQLN